MFMLSLLKSVRLLRLNWGRPYGSLCKEKKRMKIVSNSFSSCTLIYSCTKLRYQNLSTPSIIYNIRPVGPLGVVSCVHIPHSFVLLYSFSNHLVSLHLFFLFFFFFVFFSPFILASSHGFLKRQLLFMTSRRRRISTSILYHSKHCQTCRLF